MGEVPDLYPGDLHLREGVPITGGSGQGTNRTVCEDVVVVAADVLDLVDEAVVAPDPIPGLRDVLGAVRGDGDGIAVRDEGLFPDVDAVGGAVVADIDAYCLADIPELDVVAAVDGVSRTAA